jgi:hypothetical protein
VSFGRIECTGLASCCRVGDDAPEDLSRDAAAKHDRRPLPLLDVEERGVSAL